MKLTPKQQELYDLVTKHGYLERCGYDGVNLYQHHSTMYAIDGRSLNSLLRREILKRENSKPLERLPNGCVAHKIVVNKEHPLVHIE